MKYLFLLFVLSSFQFGSDLNIKSDPSYQIYTIEAVYFDSCSSTIDPEAAIELEKLSNALKSIPDIKIELTPHLDSIEYRTIGKILASQRLNSVSESLIKLGVPASRIIMGKYKNQYLHPNNNKDNRHLNRSVTIKAVK